MSINPLILLGREVAVCYPAIADFDSAVGAIGDMCVEKGVVAPDRTILVRALLMGYLMLGKERRMQ